MRVSNILWVAAVSSVVACAAEVGSDDGLADVEETDGKADAWYGDQPYGTYIVRDGDFGAGDLTMLTLNKDRTYRREILRACGDDTCDDPTVEEGKFKFTTGGKTRYIRFLTKNGSLRDRYAWELHGRQLLVRKVGNTAWIDLWTTDAFGTIDSKFAGAYTAYGRGGLPEGGVFDLQLHDNGRFHMTVEAVHACHAAGHACSESFSDGYTGSSYIFGTWQESADGKGAQLTPYDDVNDRAGWVFDLAIELDGGKAVVSGKDGSLELHGELDVQALFNAPHEVADGDLTGTWKVSQDADEDHLRLLTGFGTVQNGREHQVTFDAATGEMCELSPNENVAPDCGIYQVAGDARGGELGVIYSYSGMDFKTLRLERVTENKLVVSIDGDFDEAGYEFRLERITE